MIFENHGFVDKYIGDAIMALFPKDASSAVAAGLGMLAGLEEFNIQRAVRGEAPVRIGIGLNTGISMLGAVGGANKMEGTVISDAVNLASRLEALTKVYGAPLLISEHTLYSLDNASEHCIRFIDRVLVKGKSRPQSVYEIFDNDPPRVRDQKKRDIELFEKALACYHYRDIDTSFRLLSRCLSNNPQDKPAVIYLERCEKYRQTGHHESTGELDIITSWKDEYNIGIEEVDKQHRELMDQINRLSSAVSHGLDASEIISAITFLAEYVGRHFQTEDNLMVEFKYPFIKEHRKQHQIFKEYFDKLRHAIDRISDNKLFLSFRIQVFLVDWLINHTTKTDKHLGKYLREKM